ncbi:Chromatin remodeling protein EBS [Heracleum sosnowskyi]|uniref:Chromatin remodeling protein EBS n=1 Tax=Heracleum sosnowskyi TaxID=360622 RepID=A0AAD8LY32_9APIA|nr:Chromatin remodeling protein EBS [Heracleum sosnowskyi]
MSNTRNRKQNPDFYSLGGSWEIVRAGDCVLLKPSQPDKEPYVARVQKIKTDTRGKVMVTVRWYYRPEEASGGRRKFHGAKELFLSDHYDTQSAKTIEGKCIVHSFEEYTNLEHVGAADYYSRFEYKARTKKITPVRVAVYCKCEMPYNPDYLMMQCDDCKGWFHPHCLKMTIAEAKQLNNYDENILKSATVFFVKLVAVSMSMFFQFVVFQWVQTTFFVKGLNCGPFLSVGDQQTGGNQKQKDMSAI